MATNLNELQICSYNVQSLGKKKSKLFEKNGDLENLLKKSEISFLVETWMKSNDLDEVKNSVDGYTCFGTCRKLVVKYRGSGGILCCVKNSIKDGVEMLTSESDDLLWIKLSKDFFGFEKDVFICGVYISPDENNAVVYANLDKRPFEILLDETTRYNELGDVALVGDFNARTSNLNCLPTTRLTNSGPTTAENLHFPEGIRLQRKSSDDKTNPNTQSFLELCAAGDLFVLNGRCEGDFDGAFTSFQRTGRSVIDYGLINATLLRAVIEFKVGDSLMISDHRPIFLRLACQALLVHQNVQGPQYPPQQKLMWNNDKSKALEQLFLTTPYQIELAKINVLADNSDTIAAVTQFEQLLLNGATTVSEFKKQNVKKWHGRKNIKLSPECRLLKRTTRQLLRAYEKADGNERQPLGDAYYACRENYRCKIKAEIDADRESIVREAERLSENGQQAEAWKAVKKLKGGTKPDKSGDVKIEDWVPHFSKVGKAPDEIEDWQKRLDERIISSVELNNFKIESLDAEITTEEVLESIKLAKPTHSSGDDKIPMDILKAVMHSISPCVAKIFRNVLISGKFPLPWKRGVIVPLHKKGDTSIAANYRGITLSSNLSKILSRVLNARLTKYLETNNILRNEQAGFRANLRTTNHAFTLHTLSQQYLKKGKKLYTCFVDFKAAFDSIWRKGMWFKFLVQYGIGGNFLNLLMDMNHDIVNRVRVAEGFTDFFSSDIGVKQGDNLSPSLFALFLNDLPSLFSEEDFPAKLGTESFSCLLYADDLVIISETPEGLQSAVTKLENYCKRWRLTVNILKTKTLIFHKGGRKVPIQIMMNGEIIENTKEYEYLGIIFTISGSMTAAMEQQYRKALRAWFALTNAIPNEMISNMSYVSRLFDALVAPIALYGSEIWAFQLKEGSPIERLNRKMCKYLLNVSKRASTSAVLGELGRCPMKIVAESRALSFWQYMRANPSSLVGKVYLQLLQLNMEQKDWLSEIKASLYNLRSSDLWFQTPPYNPSKYFRKIIANRLLNTAKANFANEWHEDLNGPDQPKLRTYRLFKQKFEP